MRRFMISTVMLLAIASAGIAQAQSPVGFELRGGAAFPTEDLDDASLKTGGGAGFTINYRFMPQLLAYAGWDWFLLKTDEPFGGAAYDVENTGYAFGLQIQHPVLKSVGYWVRAGGRYSHIELEDADGDLAADSGHEFGWEAGGGVRIAIGEHFALTPGVRYRTLSADLTVGQTTVPVDLSYLTAEIGIQYSIGPARVITALVR